MNNCIKNYILPTSITYFTVRNSTIDQINVIDIHLYVFSTCPVWPRG